MTVYLEDFILKEFSGRQVLLVASQAAYALAIEHQNNFDVVIAFNCRTDNGSLNLSGLQVTHWCVNLGCKSRAIPQDVPIIAPQHKKWGSLVKAVRFFDEAGQILIHPQSEVFPFEFQQIGERLGRSKQPSCGMYLIHRLLNAGITPTLVGFTGKVKPDYHDPGFEKRVLR